VDPNDKVEIYEELRATNREGVVFKDMDAPSARAARTPADRS
jgi:ATP-dependent RNA circularization protein (DNA/RNA ligase family)